MANKEKQNLRYKKACLKLAKPKYPDCPHLKKILKIDERMEILRRHIDHIWERMNKKGFRPIIDNENPEYFADFDELAEVQKELEKLNKQIDRLEVKGYSIEKAKETFYLLNKGKLSQSF